MSLNRALIRSQPQETRHGPTEVAASTDAYYFVNLQLRGRCRVQHRGHDSVVEPGQFVVLDTAEPYYLDFDTEWTMLSYRVPHADLDERIAGRRTAIGGLFDAAGPGAAAGALARSFWGIRETLPAAASRDLEQAFAASVSAALLSAPFDPSAEASGVSRLLILRFIRDRLSDPALSVDTVCRAFHISPRSLHSVFEGHDETFAATVRSMRMTRAAEMLAGAVRTPSVADVAVAVGYDDPSSFGRAFRRHWGASPSAFRDG